MKLIWSDKAYILVAAVTFVLALAVAFQTPSSMFPTGNAAYFVAFFIMVLSYCTFESRNWVHEGETSLKVVLIRLFRNFLVVGLAGAFIVLAGATVLAARFDRAWILLATVPSVMILRAFFAAADKKDTSDKSAQSNGENRTSVSGVVLAIFIASVPMFLQIACMGIGTFLFVLLKAALLKNAALSIGKLPYLTWALVKTLAPFAIGAVVLVTIIWLVFFLFAKARDWAFQKNNPNAKKDLSHKDLTLIERATEHVTEYAKQQKSSFALAWIVILPVLFGLPALFFFFSFTEDGIGSSLFEPFRVPENGWYLYKDDFGVFDIGLMFWGMLVSPWLFGWLVTLDRKLCLELLFSSNDPKHMSGILGTLTTTIVQDVRTGYLKSIEEFDPEAWAIRTHKRTTRLFGACALVTGVLILPFLFFDRMNYVLITDDHIIDSNYFLPVPQTTKLEDVREILIVCRNDRDGDPMFGYELRTHGERTVTLAELRSLKFAKPDLPIERWQRIHEVVISNGGVVTFPTRGLVFDSMFDEKECRSILEKQVPSEYRKAVIEMVLG